MSKNTITFDLANSEEMASAFTGKVVGDSGTTEVDWVITELVPGEKAVCAVSKVVFDEADEPGKTIENTGENSSSMTMSGEPDATEE
jgi:hypothetical protein